MAHISKARVADTTTTTGTGAITVSGTAAASYRTFSAVCSVGDTFWYFIAHQSAGEWEEGFGTYSAANTITRTAVLDSSNAGAAVSFSAGTKDVAITLAADKTLQLWSSVAGIAKFIGAGAYTYNLPAGNAELLSNAVAANLSKGFTVTPNSIATGSFTVNPQLGNYQYVTNNGAYTITAPTSDCAVDILVTNGASAGATTFSGFTVGSSTGSALTTTNGNRFLISIRRINGVSTYSIYALQ